MTDTAVAAVEVAEEHTEAREAEAAAAVAIAEANAEAACDIAETQADAAVEIARVEAEAEEIDQEWLASEFGRVHAGLEGNSSGLQRVAESLERLVVLLTPTPSETVVVQEATQEEALESEAPPEGEEEAGPRESPEEREAEREERGRRRRWM